MGDLRSCRAAAWGFAPRPVGRGWPTGTCRRLLSRIPACRNPWGRVSHSPPLSRTASQTPDGQRQHTDETVLSSLIRVLNQDNCEWQSPPLWRTQVLVGSSNIQDCWVLVDTVLAVFSCLYLAFVLLCYFFSMDAYLHFCYRLCCCNRANFPIVGLVKDDLI